jgi:hypothetical protein
MLVEALHDAKSFVEATEAFLVADEARNNLAPGLAGTARDHPAVYHGARFWLVRADEEVVGAELRTPPHSLVVAGPADDDILSARATSLSGAREELPGVTEALHEVAVPASGPVYTRPTRRRRGYASAVAAAVTVDLLTYGWSFWCRYTDVANPSHRVYEAIGYASVCDAVEYSFDPPPR